MTDPGMKALDDAIDAAGGVASLASRVGVASSAPSMWKARGRVPAEHCPAIEQATGGVVRCEALRPDVPWGVLRAEPGAEPGAESGLRQVCLGVDEGGGAPLRGAR